MVNWKEIFNYKDLLFFLMLRDVRIRYAQSILGIAWAIVQPLLTMVVFTLVFGRMAKISSGNTPYALFSYAALVPWTYFSNALIDSSNSLTNNSAMLTKIYFPRLILPLSATLAKLLDFFIALILLFALLIYYQASPQLCSLWTVPLLAFLMVLFATGLGMWITALAVQYRDIRYIMSFGVQLLMYACPVIYSTSKIPASWQCFYALNPMVGVIEGFRSALLNTGPLPINLIVCGFLSAIVVFVTGSIYFQSMEKIFADVI